MKPAARRGWQTNNNNDDNDDDGEEAVRQTTNDSINKENASQMKRKTRKNKKHAQRVQEEGGVTREYAPESESTNRMYSERHQRGIHGYSYNRLQLYHGHSGHHYWYDQPFFLHFPFSFGHFVNVGFFIGHWSLVRCVGCTCVRGTCHDAA